MVRPPNYPACKYCGKNHGGKCLYVQEDACCYECGEKGHKKSECPKFLRRQNRVPPLTEQPRPLIAPRDHPR